MNTVIYADILVVINIAVNYLLLRASAVITGYRFKTTRILLSSAAGGLFSLIIFIENIPNAVNLMIKILFLSLMVLIAFEIKSVKAFLKFCCAFFLCNIAFAGIMLLLSLTVMPYSAIYRNGIVYFDTNIFTLTVTSVICYIIITLISKLIKSRVPQNHIYPIRIHNNGKLIEGTALFDSGNSLCDCFSGKPVIIAEKDFVRALLDGKEYHEMKKFRLIPYTTISNGGALPAFTVDRVEITVNGKWTCAEEVFIAVTERKIVSGGYSVLIGAPFFETLKNQPKGGNAENEKETKSFFKKSDKQAEKNYF